MRLVFRNAKSQSSNNKGTRDDDSKETMGNTGRVRIEERKRRVGCSDFVPASGNTCHSRGSPARFWAGGRSMGPANQTRVTDAYILRDLT